MATNPISFTGLNGFDFGSMINAIIQGDSAPLLTLQGQQAAVQAKDTAMTQLGSRVSDLESLVAGLVDPTAFSNASGTSSDTTTVGVTTTSGAIPAHYDITVGQIAKAQVTTSTTSNTNTTDIVADGGSISFTIGGVTTTPITITSATSLAQLQTQINNQNSGVVASIVNTGSANKLVVSSRSTGTANGFTINNSLTYSAGTVLAFAPGQNATTGNTQNSQDAQVTINGLNITNSSNSISTAFQGVSFNLVKAGTASVDVTSNYDNIKSALRTLVADYNKLLSFKTTESLPDSSGNRGPLAGDPVLRQTVSAIQTTLLGTNSNGGVYHYLAEVGVQLQSDGTLSFDETAFNTAVTTHPVDLAKLFQGTSNNGVFNTLQTQLTALDPTAGLIKTTRDSIAQTLNRYSLQIADQQARLDKERSDLEKVYAAADQLISQLNSYSSSISSLASQNFSRF